ncbi:hypothetical protein [Pseudomonas rhizophila]|uniref:Peptidase C39 domain-containing protein n=1 Tax=Pseudomonas rhizophila TaxID=2045200 RepID=A0ABM6UHV1_9PSED|nr:hypothetical protein [Pseudomonas rhizophila]AVU77113.1 hypothetical protein CRX69_18635 [Pseudomonas rhizophila]
MSKWSPTTMFQAQPCPTSCMSACVAMALNIPVGMVRREHHDTYHEGGSLRDVLQAYGVGFESFDSADRHSINRSGLWLLAVPSLNIEGGLHQILVEFDKDSGTWVVFDPNRTVGERKFYSAAPDDEGPLARALSGFSTDAFIPIEEVARIRARKAA